MTLATFIRGLTRRLNRARHDRSADQHATAGVRATIDANAEDIHLTRHINHALDRAIKHGQHEYAERIVLSALRLGGHLAPQLIERIARLRLIQGQLEAALEVIDCASDDSCSLRMLRIACQVLAGRRLEAHFELHRWSKSNACPLEARCLLAILDEELGFTTDAQRALLRNVRQLDDPQSFELLALIAASHGRRELAREWMERLSGYVPSRIAALSPRLLAESLELPITRSIDASTEDVDALAAELLVNEPVIPALVMAQELEPEESVAQLVYRAIERSLPELVHRHVAIESLVRLSLVMGRWKQATEWIERAIEENQITTAMARLAGDLVADGCDERSQPLGSHDHHEDVIGRLIDALSDAADDSETAWKRAA
jgi:tetratricopeptide (TPR) repeat protein